jgi:nucleoside-diphosphate-sugar epimerase
LVVAKIAATVAEWVARIRGTEPLLTKFLVSEMGTDHYFSIDAARKLLGYAPRYSVEEGLRRTFEQGEAQTRIANG